MELFRISYIYQQDYDDAEELDDIDSATIETFYCGDNWQDVEKRFLEKYPYCKIQFIDVERDGEFVNAKRRIRLKREL
jgi:hypothetical protein